MLRKSGFAILKGKQVGLITNNTGLDADGESTADLLAHAPGVRLVALFSPEHGIRGERNAGEQVNEAVDSRTHLPVYSLYGTTQKPMPIALNAVDVLVFDIQDVGTRFYTYISTMGMAMEAAAQRGIGFVVLDRPNPIGGTDVEGEVLEPWVRHFTAYFSIPVRHGLTVGELARWYNETAHLHLDLTVIPMTGWTRGMLAPDTNRPLFGRRRISARSRRRFYIRASALLRRRMSPSDEARRRRLNGLARHGFAALNWQRG